MSYTGKYHVFGGFSESGFDSVLQAIYQTRPRYFHYATPAIAPQDTVSITQIPVGPFGLQYEVSFDLPTIDIYPPVAVDPDPLPPGADQFTLQTAVTVMVQVSGASQSSKLGLFVKCQPSPGGAVATFAVKAVDIVGVTPPALATVLEIIVQGFFQQLLASVRIPLGAFAIPPVTIVLQDGPNADMKFVFVRGDLQ